MTTALRGGLAVAGTLLGFAALSGSVLAQTQSDSVNVYTPGAEGTTQMSLADAAKACGVAEDLLSKWQQHYCVAVSASGSSPASGAAPASSASSAAGG